VETRSGAPQRSDAQRNRERILEVARVELARSTDVPLSLIARRAGVGQGTLYRHFPSRDALVLEIYRHEVQLLTDRAADLLETREPDQALREWMDQLARFAMTKVGLADALRRARTATGTPERAGYPMVIAAIESLLTANHEAGTIRPGVTAEDFGLLSAGIWQIELDGDWQARTARLLDLIMDGLRSGAPGR
jgi:AcrR family transcriptional regulator